jgi:hypothetical protein
LLIDHEHLEAAAVVAEGVEVDEEVNDEELTRIGDFR